LSSTRRTRMVRVFISPARAESARALDATVAALSSGLYRQF
jgi:hypothetical protein